MRNLALVTELRTRVAVACLEEKLVAAAYDSNHGRFFFASDSCNIYSLPVSGSEGEWCVSLLEPTESRNVLDMQLGDRVIALEYVLEEDAILVAIGAGDLLLVRPPAHDVEVVGRVEGGIVTMAPSPDGELTAIATGFGQILLMTQDWDVLYELSMAQPTDTSVLHKSHGATIPARGIQISWRGDGKYFTTLEKTGTGDVKIWERQAGTLYARAEDIDSPKTAIAWCPSGARICTSCNASSDANLPAIVFFEKNGLRKGNFSITGPPQANVDMLGWNCDSSLLAVVLRCGDWDGVQVWSSRNYHWYLKQEWRFSGGDSVDILWDPEKPLRLTCWTHSGFVHTLDMCWNSAVIQDSLALVIDGKELLVTPLATALIPPPMSLFRVSFQSPIQTISVKESRFNRTLIAAHLSDGHLSVVSCPSIDSLFSLEDEVVVAQVADKPPSANAIGRLRHLAWLDESVLLGAEYRQTEGTANREAGDGYGRNISGDELVEVELMCNSNNDVQSWVLTAVRHVPVHYAVAALAVFDDHVKGPSAFVQFKDGSLHTYVRRGDQSNRAVSTAETSFGSACPWMKVVASLSAVSLVGLDEVGHLHVDEKVVARECTSFSLHSSTLGNGKESVVHLVYTTRGNLLHVANFQEVVGTAEGANEVLHIAEHLDACKITATRISSGELKYSRDKTETGANVKPIKVWERGARLVGTISGVEVAVVLQTIRGNLETLYPRKLVLGAIAAALVQGNFEDAMTLVRRHHINLNVLVDYKGWKSFVSEAGTFVCQVGNLSHITDFVCALKKENVMVSLYRCMVPPFDPSAGFIKGGALKVASSDPDKVHGVVTAVRAALEKEIAPSPARELCILTTLACNEPPQLEEALSRVKILREAEMSGGCMARGNEGEVTQLVHALSAARAVKHLIWLTDSDKVYNAALGLYDLFLAAMVASEAQRDPKEFLPLLEDLEAMPAPLMRYSIDVRLGRLESALKHLLVAGDEHFRDSLKLVQTNPKLFPLALQLLENSDRRKEIMAAWGDHLLTQENFLDSAAAFCAAGNLPKVLMAYRSGGLWEGVLSIAGQLEMTKDERQQLAYEVCEELQAMGRPGEAAIVAREYLQDVELSVMLLVDARDWKGAVRLSNLHDRADLLSKVDMACLESASSHVAEFEEGLDKIAKYYVRYLAVRQRRLVLTAKLKEEQVEEDGVSDAASETSSNFSGVSGLSIYTRGTHSGPTGTSTNLSTRGAVRKQQKQSRKLRGGGLRAGSPGEELALLEHLKELGLSNRTKEELGPLLQILVFRAHEDIARRLQAVAARYECTQQEAVRLAEKKRAEENVAEGLFQDTKLTSQVEEFRWKLQVLTPPEGVQPASFLSVQ